MSQTALYRHYDTDGNLLYVGAARSIRKRTETHMRESKWAALSVRAEVTFFPTREEAFAAEWDAIQNESPAHNIVRTRRSLNTPPARPKRAAVGEIDSFRRTFPERWAQYLKDRYHTAYAVQKAFPGIDSHTARDWISGKRDPSGSFVAVAIARDPDAIKILGGLE